MSNWKVDSKLISFLDETIWNSYYKARAFFDVYSYITKKGLFIIINIVITILGLWLVTVTPFALIISVWPFFTVYREFKKFHEEHFKITQKKSCDLSNLKLNKDYSNYEKFNFQDQWAAYSNEINTQLLSNNYQYELFEESYEVHSNILHFLPHILSEKVKNSIIFNDKKIRLCSDLLSDMKELGLQFTDYFSGECTNEAGCNEYKSKENRILSGPELWTEAETILNLNEIKNKCANRIGAQTLAMTLDMHLVILRQSKKSAQSPGKLAPSGSGSADEKDLKGTDKNFNQFIIHTMERELREECGLEKIKKPVETTKIIGFSRILNRGGKPEFFGFSVLNIRKKDIKPPKKEAIFIDGTIIEKINTYSPDKFIECLKNSILKIKEKNGAESFSFPLILNIIFFIQYIRSNPKEFGIVLKELNDKNKTSKKDSILKKAFSYFC